MLFTVPQMLSSQTIVSLIKLMFSYFLLALTLVQFQQELSAVEPNDQCTQVLGHKPVKYQQQ